MVSFLEPPAHVFLFGIKHGADVEPTEVAQALLERRLGTMLKSRSSNGQTSRFYSCR
jgi:hypothetical protein